MRLGNALYSADAGAGQPSGLRVVHLARHGAGRPPPRQGRRHIDGGAARLTEAGYRSCSVRRNVGRTPARRSVGGLRPIRARTRSLRACFRWSELYQETDSGAVSAGSNPVEGTAQKHKFEYSDHLGAPQPWLCGLRLRNGPVMFAPHTLPKRPPLLPRRRSWHIAISAYEAVAPLSQVGTPSPTQRDHNGLASTAYMRQTPIPRDRQLRCQPGRPHRSSRSGPLGWPLRGDRRTLAP
jgi:hypothetical protein